LLTAHLYATVSLLVTGEFGMPLGGSWTVWHQGGRVLLATVVLAIGLALLLKKPREESDRAKSPWVFYALAALAAGAFAMGPEIFVKGAPVSPGPYALLMNYLPGYDGVRVPSRFVAQMTLFLAVLAGLGASLLIARARRVGVVLVILAGAFIWVEVWPTEFRTNVRLAAGELDITPRELHIGKDIPPVYKIIRDSDRPIILLEFPFGSPPWDLHALFYAGYHRQRLVNGYSGFFPESQQRLWHLFNLRREHPQAVWRGLLATGATHVLVHEAAFPERRQKEISDWLLSSGAREIVVDGTDRLFTVR
jgi:hypothetical protein